MLVTLPGMVKVFFTPGYSSKTVLSLLYNTPFSAVYDVLPASTVIEVRLAHWKNMFCPILVTLLGMLTLVRLVHS